MTKARHRLLSDRDVRIVRSGRPNSVLSSEQTDKNHAHFGQNKTNLHEKSKARLSYLVQCGGGNVDARFNGK